jgi:hypothetical protein
MDLACDEAVTVKTARAAKTRITGTGISVIWTGFGGLFPIGPIPDFRSDVTVITRIFLLRGSKET